MHRRALVRPCLGGPGRNLSLPRSFHGAGRDSMKKIAAAALASIVLAGSGCGLAFYRGPVGMEDALERQLDCELNRDFGLKLGIFTAPLASSIVRKVTA